MATRRFTEPLDLGVEMSGLPETGADVADELTLSKQRGSRYVIPLQVTRVSISVSASGLTPSPRELSQVSEC